MGQAIIWKNLPHVWAPITRGISWHLPSIHAGNKQSMFTFLFFYNEIVVLTYVALAVWSLIVALCSVCAHTFKKCSCRGRIMLNDGHFKVFFSRWIIILFIILRPFEVCATIHFRHSVPTTDSASCYCAYNISDTHFYAYTPFTYTITHSTAFWSLMSIYIYAGSTLHTWVCAPSYNEVKVA